MKTESDTILIVEDDKSIANAIADRMRHEGFKTEVCYDGITALRHALNTKPLLMILDVMLPGIDGVEIASRVKKEMYVPILMLTARDDETDVLIGLNAGADEYMKKPFSMRELVARVRALLRTVKDVKNDNAEDDSPDKITFDDVVIYPKEYRIIKNGEEVHLTNTEYNILSILMASPHTVVTRDSLLHQLWGWVDTSGTRTIDSHMKAIRRKIGADYFRTVHGVGYSFDPEGDIIKE